ncbi:MAG: type II secretion system ATPase GspE [Desulfovermiculus sp.]|nr:type II secretion system ATPase GspE [Desulfovermiculus sp.]
MANIIDRFIQRNMITRRDVDRVLEAKISNEPLHQLIIRSGLISEDDYLDVLSQELGFPKFESMPENYDPEAFSRISSLFMDQHTFVPLEINDSQMMLLVNDPFDHLVLDTVKKIYPKKRVHLILGRKERIRSILQNYFTQEYGDKDSESETEEEALESAYAFEDVEHLRDLASEAPIIKRVNQIMTTAVEEKASDIHIEPFEDRIQVRYRIDGILHDFLNLPAHMQQAISTRLKILARLDIAERRVPQDGRIQTKIAGKSIDLRVSCLPTVYGESIVLRILDRSSISLSLQNLGFPEKERNQFEELIHSPYGIILVTGPTGSGKTTTLYSALNTINSSEKKIITIEDPVEYELDGINQIQVNPKAGLTFAGGLRSIVRQDPDVILIGEIRDKETADIAIQSALTGHLVFSTLHTNDAAGALTRLMEIGVEDYLLSASVIGIMAQRLVRILCEHCKRKVVPDQTVLDRYQIAEDGQPPEVIYEPAGCSLCANTGYRDRTAIFELLVIDDNIRELILKNRSAVAIRNQGVAQGMTLLRHDGWSKVAQGVSSVQEVLRVTGQS